MNTFKTNWTKEELHVYLLIYCATADFTETKEESDFIKSGIKPDVYGKMEKEFSADNDYQSIQKIQDTLKRYEFTEGETDNLINEIKELFLADGNFDTLERNLLISIERILKA